MGRRMEDGSLGKLPGVSADSVGRSAQRGHRDIQNSWRAGNKGSGRTWRRLDGGRLGSLPGGSIGWDGMWPQRCYRGLSEWFVSRRNGWKYRGAAAGVWTSGQVSRRQSRKRRQVGPVAKQISQNSMTLQTPRSFMCAIPKHQRTHHWQSARVDSCSERSTSRTLIEKQNAHGDSNTQHHQVCTRVHLPVMVSPGATSASCVQLCPSPGTTITTEVATSAMNISASHHQTALPPCVQYNTQPRPNN